MLRPRHYVSNRNWLWKKENKEKKRLTSLIVISHAVCVNETERKKKKKDQSCKDINAYTSL